MHNLEAVFGKWGTPAHSADPGAAAWEYLELNLGAGQPRPAVAVADIPLSDSRLSHEARLALSHEIGAAHVDAGRTARLRHSAGSSLTDLVHQRDGNLSRIPDAVLRPASHDEVLAILRVCREYGIAVVPFGGGTSVVGGVTAEAGVHDCVVAVALDRIADLLDIDRVSLTATVQPGMTGPTLERLLAARGLMWGHLPQSWERATIGGYVATRSAGQASTGYGRSNELVESVVLATPRGTVRLGRAPSSAAGPDLRELFIGSEGVLGIITSVTLRVRPQPNYSRYEGLMFPDYASGVAAFRALAQADLTGTVMRLSDRTETRSTLAMSGPQGRAGQALNKYLGLRGVADGCLGILAWEGFSPSATKARRRAAWVALRAHGAVPLGARVGASWRKHRFDGPYLRDVLLDAGYIAETLETAGDWSTLTQLHDAVRDALVTSLATAEHEPLVLSHVSHVYGPGASLYFTVVARAETDRAAQWAVGKNAACDAIMANGGTITHHHAIGTDHRPWMEQEVGEVGQDVLQAVKDLVDPTGILNPGKLLPASSMMELPV